MKRILTTLAQKWPEYLLEILVITIGILGAFALNNWNDDRLQRSEEKEILRSVRKDLENTIREFEFLNGIRNRVLAGTAGILSVSDDSNVVESELDSLLGLTFYRPTFNNKLGAIDLLFSSGKINLISNDSIRSKLIALPGTIDDILEEEEYATKVFQNLYYPTLAKYVNIQDLTPYSPSISFFGAQSAQKQTVNLPSLPSDHRGLLQDREFLNHLNMRAAHMIVTNDEIMVFIEQLGKLNQSITNELNQ